MDLYETEAAQGTRLDRTCGPMDCIDCHVSPSEQPRTCVLKSDGLHRLPFLLERAALHMRPKTGWTASTAMSPQASGLSHMRPEAGWIGYLCCKGARYNTKNY